MADLALVTAHKLNVVESFEQMSLPAAEAVNAGQVVRLDVSNGKFTKANASSLAEGRAYGIATRTVLAGEALTALRHGVLDGFDLSGLAYDAAVYVSDTDGALADAFGAVNVIAGRVIPGTATTLGTAYDKLLHVDFGNGQEGAAVVPITTELLAASVDTWLFVADRPYRVMAVREVHSVVGGTGAVVTPRKVLAAATAAPGDAAGADVKELTAAAIGLETTINVAQSPALSATAADLLLAAGDKIGLNFNGTLTNLVGSLTIFLKPI